MLSRMCIGRSAFNVTQSLKSPVPQNFVPRNYVVRNYAREPRTRVATRSQPTLRERLMAPAGPNGELQIHLISSKYCLINTGKSVYACTSII